MPPGLINIATKDEQGFSIITGGRISQSPSSSTGSESQVEGQGEGKGACRKRKANNLLEEILYRLVITVEVLKSEYTIHTVNG